jgi:flagella basal body P-ring formation protein FlgA
VLIVTRALPICLLFAVALPALGAVQTRAIEVVGSSLTLRECLPPDVVVTTGDPALDTIIVTGLRPGEQRVLTPSEVSLRLTQSGFDPSCTWLPSVPIVVVRRSQTIRADDLIAAGERAIRDHLDLRAGDEAVITPVMAPRSLLAPVGDDPLSTRVKAPPLPGGLWVATVSIGDGVAPIECTIRYRVRVFSDVLVTREPLKRHQSLGDSSVSMERVEVSSLRGEVLRTTDELRGRRAARGVSAGTVVTTDWLEAVPAVRKGEAITVISRVGGVVARARVTALSDGAMGEVIAAGVGRDKEQVWVRITGQGCGEVTGQHDLGTLDGSQP